MINPTVYISLTNRVSLQSECVMMFSNQLTDNRWPTNSHSGVNYINKSSRNNRREDTPVGFGRIPVTL